MRLFQSIALPAWAEGFRAVTSTCESCHRSVTLGHLSAQKAGIKMRGRWYCSSSCFTSAAELRLSELMMSEPEQASHVSRMPLGLIFLSRGLLTSAELKEAVDEQKESGEEIGEILGVTESRVCQIHGEATRRLKESLSDIEDAVAA